MTKITEVYDNPNLRTYKVPAEALPIVKDCVQKILDLANDSLSLQQLFLAEANAIMAKYEPQAEKLKKAFERDAMVLAEEIKATRIELCKKLCEATGVTYDERDRYAIEPQFIKEHNIAFLSVLSSDEPSKLETMNIEPGMLAPPGTRLN